MFRYSCNQIRNYFLKIELLFIYSECNLSVNLIFEITLTLTVHHLCILCAVLNNETNKAFLISILVALFF